MEKLLATGPVPYSIVRATRFMEFVDAILSWTTEGDTIRLPGTPSSGTTTRECSVSSAGTSSPARRTPVSPPPVTPTGRPPTGARADHTVPGRSVRATTVPMPSAI